MLLAVNLIMSYALHYTVWTWISVGVRVRADFIMQNVMTPACPYLCLELAKPTCCAGLRSHSEVVQPPVVQEFTQKVVSKVQGAHTNDGWNPLLWLRGSPCVC